MAMRPIYTAEISLKSKKSVVGKLMNTVNKPNLKCPTFEFHQKQHKRV